MLDNSHGNEFILFCVFLSLILQIFLDFSWWNRLGASGQGDLVFFFAYQGTNGLSFIASCGSWPMLVSIEIDYARNILQKFCLSYPEACRESFALNSCGLRLFGCQHLYVFINVPLPSALNVISFWNRLDDMELLPWLQRYCSSIFRGFVYYLSCFLAASLYAISFAAFTLQWKPIIRY